MCQTWKSSNQLCSLTTTTSWKTIDWPGETQIWFIKLQSARRNPQNQQMCSSLFKMSSFIFHCWKKWCDSSFGDSRQQQLERTGLLAWPGVQTNESTKINNLIISRYHRHKILIAFRILRAMTREEMMTAELRISQHSTRGEKLCFCFLQGPWRVRRPIK